MKDTPFNYHAFHGLTTCPLTSFSLERTKMKKSEDGKKESSATFAFCGFVLKIAWNSKRWRTSCLVCLCVRGFEELLRLNEILTILQQAPRTRILSHAHKKHTLTHRHRYPLSGSCFVAMLWLYHMWSNRSLKYGGVGRGMCEFVMCLCWNRKDRRYGLQSCVILPQTHSNTHTFSHADSHAVGSGTLAPWTPFILPMVEVSAVFPGVTVRYSTICPLQNFSL